MSRDKNQRGITLIALVITIIVMLILVGVTVSIAINGGLFGMAKEAKMQTEKARDVEQELANGRILVGDTWYDSMSDYVNGNRSKDQSEGGTYFTAEKNEDGTLTENATYESGGYTAIIPAGFKVSEVAGEDKIETGLVIKDKDGNEFVWIPVNYTATGEKDEHGLDKGFLKVFYRSKWLNNARTTGLDAKYTEPLSEEEGYPNEDTEYYAMMESVQDNKGFYIGRYEAGSIEPRTSASGDTTMVVKRDQYPYNYVGWGSSMKDIESPISSSVHGAVYLSKHMYEEKNEEEDKGEDKVGVVSTLCYGVQWDAMLDFIKDGTHNVTDSITWGNYRNNAWTINRAEAKYYISSKWNSISEEEGQQKSKDNSTSIILTTGASDSFSSKNIYDVAGSFWQWTMEASLTSTRVRRGGCYDNYGQNNPASNRDIVYNPDKVAYDSSFRPALYIKN